MTAADLRAAASQGRRRFRGWAETTTPISNRPGSEISEWT